MGLLHCGGFRDGSEPIDLDDKVDEEDDPESNSIIKEGGDEMITSNSEGVEDVEAEHIDEDLYPPFPAEDLKITA